MMSLVNSLASSSLQTQAPSKKMMWHGTKGDQAWPLPELVAASSEANRADQGNTILVCQSTHLTLKNIHIYIHITFHPSDI